MSKLTAKIKRDLPLRISLMIVLAMALLLTVTLLVMLHSSRNSMKDDALNRATYTLDRATNNIDNILLSVEETAGNIYFNMKFDDPERMYTYAHKIVETNPYVSGCVIAFKPGYFKGHDLFMVYAHSTDSTHQDHSTANIVHSNSFGTKPYTEQIWFNRPIGKNRAMWMNPLLGMKSDIEPLTSFCAPILDANHSPIGVISVHVPLQLLSSIISAARPSPNSYCALVDNDGSFIVDPTAGYLSKIKAFNLPGSSVQEAVKTMMSGNKGYLPFDIDGRKFYLFYQPFRMAKVPYRTLITNPGWSIGVVFSENDIFGEYNKLFNFVIIIAIVGMVLMYLHTRLIIRHRLKPLRMLTEFTDRIAHGHYNEPLPSRHRNKDEIGVLQGHFQQMQRSVAANINELHELTQTIQERSKELHIAYEQAQKADRMKTAFLHNMTDQMVAPSFAIDEDVSALSHFDKKTSTQTVNQLVEDIQQNGDTITQILNNLINLSEKEEDLEEKGGKL